MPQLPHSLDYIRQVVAEYFADKPVRPSIDWTSIKNFRNLLAHEYFRTDYPQVWHIATNLLLGLLPTLEALFTSLDQQLGPNANV